MFRSMKNKIDYKARLEHKLYLARENPEPIFDLSDCDLKQVPAGIFSLCKVFLKEALYLGNNRLDNLKNGGSIADLKLLFILDLQKNSFYTLPEEIKFLTNLRELYINDNHLKKLPDGLTSLFHLIILDVSNNSLQMLPDSFGNLGHLNKLSISDNKKLTKLPKSFCGLRNLKELFLDADRFIYPPKEVCKNGVNDILNYIVEDCGIPYESPIIYNEDSSSKVCEYGRNAYEFEEKILQLEKLKELKQQELLSFEKYNETVQQQELKLQDEKRADKQKLLNDLAREQDKIESELVKFQREKDVDRQNLISELQAEELETEKAIHKFLETCSTQYTTQLLEYEERETALLFEAINKDEELKRQEIIKGMQSILEEEKERFQEYSRNKDKTMHTILIEELDSSAYLNDIVTQHVRNNENLNTQLLEDNTLQMAAVGALLERSDVRSWSLVQQVNFVSNQLAKLTAIELDKRKLKIDEQINDLSQQRVELSTVLLDLLSQKTERHNQLLTTLRELENIGESAEDDFWLMQYKRLLDRRPELIANVQRNLNPELLQGMLMNGVMHCLPFLAPWAYSDDALASITDSDLLEVGITKNSERKIVLDLISAHIRKEVVEEISIVSSSLPKASAPPLIEESTKPVVNNFSTVECVICMERYCEVLYVPCGHLCVCMECSTSVDICPLCRATIEKRVKVITA